MLGPVRNIGKAILPLAAHVVRPIQAEALHDLEENSRVYVLGGTGLGSCILKHVYDLVLAPASAARRTHLVTACSLHD